MNEQLIYLLKVNIAFTMLYVFYRVALHRSSYFKINRFLLLSFIPVAFLIPIIEIKQSIHLLTPNQAWINNLNTPDIAFPFDNTMTLETSGINFWKSALTVVYLVGISILSWRFASQLQHLFRISQHANRYKHNLYLTASNQAPFSFFRKIFLPQNFHQIEGKQAIIAHERVHVHQWHSFDRVLAELFTIVCWFNPFVFLFKKSLRDIHEFQADYTASKQYASVSSYLQVLQVNLNAQAGMYNYFNNSSIKKRLNMILQTKNTIWNKLAYTLIVPVILISFYAFSDASIDNGLNDVVIIEKADNTPSINPIDKKDIQKVASGYGMRMHPIYKIEKMHQGIDIVAFMRTPIHATADGTVIKKEFKAPGKGYGRYLIIQHNNTYSTLYAQMADFNCELNDQVKKGDIIGYVGSSGMSTGAHLHYEIRKNGVAVNPADYIKD